jgi:hypothetical protein
MDLPEFLSDLDTLTTTALRAVCHAYGNPPLVHNPSRVHMMEIARTAMETHGSSDWKDFKQRVLRLRGLGAAQMLTQQQLHVNISVQQQRMAAEAARMDAIMAAIDADDDDDSDLVNLSFEHLSPGTRRSLAAFISVQAARQAAQLHAVHVQPSAKQQVEAFFLDLKAGHGSLIFDGKAIG